MKQNPQLQIQLSSIALPASGGEIAPRVPFKSYYPFFCCCTLLLGGVFQNGFPTFRPAATAARWRFSFDHNYPVMAAQYRAVITRSTVTAFPARPSFLAFEKFSRFSHFFLCTSLTLSKFQNELQIFEYFQNSFVWTAKKMYDNT